MIPEHQPIADDYEEESVAVYWLLSAYGGPETNDQCYSVKTQLLQYAPHTRGPFSHERPLFSSI